MGPRPGPGGFGRRDNPRDTGPKPPKATIIFKDSFVLAVYKPAGIPVKGGQSPTLVESVDQIAGARRARMRVAHDIDAFASGIVLFAETRNSEDTPRQQTRPETTYIVVVEGVFEEEEHRTGKTINAPVSKWTGQGATPATNLRVLDSGNGLSILQVRARPDLPGQVREHLALIGHPIVGDRQNGSSRDDLRRLAMHAAEVRFVHPEEDKRERVKCPSPASFWQIIGKEPPAGVVGAVDPVAEQERQDNQEDSKGWDHVAGWYDDLITERGSVHHETVIVPGVTRMLDLQPGEKLVDIACGQGMLCEYLAKHTPAESFVGVDLSPALIEKANERATDRTSYMVGDVLKLSELGLEGFDAASCVMAMMNFDPIEPVFEGVAGCLKPGGRFVCVILHPSFRITNATAWGWTTDERTRDAIQYRRVDQYMSDQAQDIVMNPGQVARGKPAITTTTYHRPIGRYINAMTGAGLLVDSIEEWTSTKVSEPGPRAMAENMARREIPLFMAIRVTKKPNA